MKHQAVITSNGVNKTSIVVDGVDLLDVVTEIKGNRILYLLWNIYFRNNKKGNDKNGCYKRLLYWLSAHHDR